MVLYLGWRCSCDDGDDDEKDEQNAEDDDDIDREVVKKALTLYPQCSVMALSCWVSCFKIYILPAIKLEGVNMYRS